MATLSITTIEEPTTRHLSTSTRDAALRRLGRINRWLLAGSVALTGLFSEVAANAFPGRTAKSTKATGITGTHSSGTGAKTQTSTHKQLQPPVQAPQSTSPETTPTQGSSPSQESAPAKEVAPGKEPTPSAESAPAQESASSQEAAPTKEATPAQESTPVQEPSAPVVSGGS